MNRVELKNILEKLLSRETDQDYKQIEEIIEMLVLSEMHTAGRRRLPWLIRALQNVNEKLARDIPKFWKWKDWREEKFKKQGFVKQYGVWVFPEEVESPSQKETNIITEEDS